MSDGHIPIRYILYSHYGFREGDDFAEYKNGTHPKDLEGVRHLLGHLRGLRELLTAPGHEGLIVLFYAPGYERFLEGLAHQEDDKQMIDGDDDDRLRLRFARDVSAYVQREFREARLAERARFLTSFDLRVILGRVNAIFSGKFKQFFLGTARGIRYDAPKVVEAILRLRVLGNGVPVLRLDHDVIFRGTNKNIGDLGLFKALACTVRAYQLRVAQPTVSTFLFSASYNSRALLDQTDEMDRFEAWSRAFATRIYPAMVANPSEIQQICSLPETTDEEKQQKSARWNQYVKKYLNDSLARQFYGLTEKPDTLEPLGIEGLTSIGAHPLYSVISGALLCLSDGAILDLPPFSNLGLNVMWIDDHLKYSLHRAMNHFTSGENLDLEPGLSDARLDDVTVTKGRPPVGNLHNYIFDIYLPTLLWGAVMDSWITTEPILKCRVAKLNAVEQSSWRKARENQQDAPLPRAMLEALRVGSFDPDSEQKLREDLTRTAIDRIEQVRRLWTLLRTEVHGSFASYWAEGKVEEFFGRKLFSDKSEGLWKGIAPSLPLDQPITRMEDLSTPVALKLSALINDTVAYVHWTLEWPRFVQIVRSIRQGDFSGDLSWQP